MKDKTIKGAMNDVEKIIRDVYSQGYNDGLKDGKASVQIDDSAAYKAGLKAAWELVRRVSNLGYNDRRKEIFGERYGLTIDIVKNFSVTEVADKIIEHEVKQKADKIIEHEVKQKMVEDAEIKVGDEVIYCGGGAHDGSVGVVIGAEDSWREVRFKSCWNCVGVWKDALTKTGRHFSQIEEVLEQMKGEE